MSSPTQQLVSVANKAVKKIHEGHAAHWLVVVWDAEGNFAATVDNCFPLERFKDVAKWCDKNAEST